MRVKSALHLLMGRDERQLQQRPYLDDALAVRLGGRAAEELVFGVPSTGASDDLTSATDLAGRMVRQWGMSDVIGKIAWGPRGPVFLGEDLIHTREYSDETARLIDEEVSRILDALATALVTQESLDADQICRIVDDADGGVVRRLPAVSA